MASNPLVTWYRGLPPNTRRIVLAGSAAGAGLLVLRSRNASPPAEAEASGAGEIDEYATGGPGLPVEFSNDALGVDQLLEFESKYALDLADVMERVDDLVNKPQGRTTIPYAVRQTYVLKVGSRGETPNQIAVRLRKAGERTADNRDLTAAYLIRFNQWNTKATDPRWPGEIVSY